MAQATVLVVDDEKAYCRVMRDILESYNLKVYTAHTACKASDLLGDSVPDLILLDVMMPNKDGLSFLRQLRTNPAWFKIPIIVISAKAMEEDRFNALAAGADKFIGKPFTMDELQLALVEYLPITAPN